MPASVQVAMVPAAPKSASSGWATTTSARSTSLSGRGCGRGIGLGSVMRSSLRRAADTSVPCDGGR